jgi:hypothetical protein
VLGTANGSKHPTGLSKVGFEREGVLRDSVRYDHGYDDIMMMAMLEDEYQARRGHPRP